jgi:FkbM family methyltransferase
MWQMRRNMDVAVSGSANRNKIARHEQGQVLEMTYFFSKIRHGLQGKSIASWCSGKIQFFRERRDMCLPRMSYAQSGEDLILRHVLNSMKVPKPTYCDIGAHHPYYLSNTAHFYLSGSIGINIEPNPILFKEFLVHRRNDINLNVGVSDHSSQEMFYQLEPSTMSTFSRAEAEARVSEYGFKMIHQFVIPVSTLPEILHTHARASYPDFLSIDVEGMDQLILESIDYSQWSPLVICCETLSFSQTGIGTKNLPLIDFLKSRGYMVYADTNINTIFVLEKAWASR